MQWVNLKELMLIPKTIREVERCLLGALLKIRAVLCLTSKRTGPISLHQALRLLTRLAGMGSIGKASVAHVLTMLGGPMERMESWGPPGRNKRRPCKVAGCRCSGGQSIQLCGAPGLRRWLYATD